MRFNRLSLEEGLAQSTVYAIIQDRRGYIWMATEDGLHRYDGYSFTIFRNDPNDPASISESQVYSLLEDRAGHIWIGTLNGGLNRYDPSEGKFTAYRAGHSADSLSNDTIHSLMEDRAGHIWAGTERGLDRLDPATGRFTRYLTEPEEKTTSSDRLVWALYEDPSGAIWIGTNDGVRIYHPDTDSFEHPKLDGRHVRIDGKSASVIRGDRLGNVWIGSETGIMVYDAHRHVVAEYTGADNGGQLTSGRVRDILFSGTGEVWVALYRGGLAQLDPRTDKVVVFRHDDADRNSLSDDGVLSLLEDRGGVLWAGTEAGGASRFNPATRRFLHYRHQSGNPRSLADPMVWSVLPARDGSLWVGQQTALTRIDRAKGLYRHFHAVKPPPDAPKHWIPPGGTLRGQYVSALLQSADGRIWIGTDKGLNRLRPDGASFDAFPFKGTDDDDERYLNSISAIIEDGAGGLWVGTSEGLVRFDPQHAKVTRYRAAPDTPDALPSDYIIALARSKDGTLWVCTDTGVVSLAPGASRFDRLPIEGDLAHRLSNRFVQAVVEDLDGTMWFGTADGLDRYDRKTKAFQHFGVAQGLPNDTVYTLVRTEDGALWMSTNRGLARFDPRTFAVRTWLVEDGLQSNEFNGGAAARDARGELFFGGVNGLNAFDPAQLVDHQHPPDVAITQLELLDSVVPLTGAIARDRRIVLDHTQPVLTLQYAVFDYAAPNKNAFRFWLEGFDPGWREGGHHNSVTYTNLDPGEYVFHVKGANTHGVWSADESTLRVTVLPPPWRSWWAYLGYVLLSLGLVFASARIHHFKVKRDHELRAEQAKRRWSETLHQLSQSLASSHDAHQIAELLMDSLRRMVSYRSAALFVEQGVEVQLVGTRGFDDERARALRTLPDSRARLFAECRHKREAMVLPADEIRGSPLAGEGSERMHVLAIPTFSRAEEFALLVLCRAGEPFTPQEQEIAVSVASQALVALDNARLFSELQNLATTDNLTKVNNRRYFFELAELEFARSRRYGRNLGVVLLDADGFTQINDAHGHEVGDRVLRLIASTCRASLRHFDIIGRYGGEDFVVMLPETALNVAADVADRLRKAVESMVIETHSGELRVTVSLGVAVLTADVPDLATLINRADMALYEAKRSGRNRVVVAEQH